MPPHGTLFCSGTSTDSAARMVDSRPIAPSATSRRARTVWGWWRHMNPSTTTRPAASAAAKQWAASRMSAPPPRPAQPVAAIAGGLDEQRGEQVLESVAGQPDQPVRWSDVGLARRRRAPPGRRAQPSPGWSNRDGVLVDVQAEMDRTTMGDTSHGRLLPYVAPSAIVDDPRPCYLRNGAGRSMLTKRLRPPGTAWLVRASLLLVSATA
jgi:hypothetical protein